MSHLQTIKTYSRRVSSCIISLPPKLLVAVVCVLIALGIGLVNAAWNTTKNAGDPILSADWNALVSHVAVPTRQVFMTAGAGTYTTPANVRQIRVRMVGGGGGGGGLNGAMAAGGAGGATIFNSIAANGGAGGAAGANSANGWGSWGSGWSWGASLRASGQNGMGGWAGTNYAPGGSSLLGLGGMPNPAGGSAAAPTPATGYGGGGAGGSNSSPSSCGGGGWGEYAEIIITNPTASYGYTVGAAGTGGTWTNAGGAGAVGVIIVDEYY